MALLRTFVSIVCALAAGSFLDRADVLWPPSRDWLIAALTAVIVLAVLNAWRAVAPHGTGRGPFLLVLIAAVTWIVVARPDVRISRLLFAGVLILLAIIVQQIGIRDDQPSPSKPLRALLWVRRRVTWAGRLPAIAKVTVVFGAAILDMSDADFDDGVDLQLTVIGGRLELDLPANWRIEPTKSGFLIDIQAPPAPSPSRGPALHLRLIGLGAVVQIRRILTS